MKDITAMTDLLLEGLLESGPNGIAIMGVTADQVELVYANQRFFKDLGYSRKEIKGQEQVFFTRLQLHRQDRIYAQVVEASLRGRDVVEREMALSGQNGQIRWIKQCISLLENCGDSMYFFVTHTDVTRTRQLQQHLRYEQEQQQRQEEQQKKQALEAQLNTDLVTGLDSAQAVQQAVESYLEHQECREATHTMMVLKIQGMDHIFQCYGAVFGNAVLQNLADTVRQNFRATDITGRLSADEFLVFLREVPEVTACRKAEDICHNIRGMYTGEQPNTELSCRVGMSHYPQHGASGQELLDKALAAVLHGATGNGSGITTYEAEMPLIGERQVELCFPQENRLREQYNMSLLSFGFSLLSNSRDMNSSINLLLERIGKEYDLSYVYIYEQEDDQLYPTNFWGRSQGVKREDPELEGRFMGLKPELDGNGFLCMDDCQTARPGGALDILIEEKHLKSLMVCGFSDPILGEGDIFFCDCKRKRQWTQVEKSTLYEFGRMLSVFVFLRNGRLRDKKRITELLSQDQLTGLLNRDAFEEKALEELAGWDGVQEYALIFTDINDFEYVNSNFGYEAGDQMLLNYGIDLADMPGARLCCRMHSDYFLILCSASSRKELENAVKEASANFIERQRKMYPASNLRVSTGIYFLEHCVQGYDFSTVVENANLARKQVKEQRGGQIFVYQERLRQEREHAQYIAGSFHSALHNKEIEVFLQPKFSLTKRVVIGAEALVRWRRKDGTLRAPMDFIPVLEEVGYIVDLDFYVYEQVLKNMRRWKDQGKHQLPVSINFSRCHIRHENFVNRVCQLASLYEIETPLVEIEITESCISGDNQKLFQDMQSLRQSGFKVHIDDFGTGYSSLNMLLQAPVDTVKVDKSFLQHIGESQKERNYVNHLAHLITAAEKEIVFEGVETEGQAQILTDCGYTMAQGFLFGKPMPVQDYERIYLVGT